MCHHLQPNLFCGCGEQFYVDYNWPVMCTHGGVLRKSTSVDPSSDRPVTDDCLSSNLSKLPTEQYENSMNDEKLIVL